MQAWVYSAGSIIITPPACCFSLVAHGAEDASQNCAPPAQYPTWRPHFPELPWAFEVWGGVRNHPSDGSCCSPHTKVAP
eukprot:365208-Chlamydomonas_euryale.AAC.13